MGIKRGNYLLNLEPDNDDIRYKVAFLLYFDKQTIAAKKLWKEVLKHIPKRKRTFELLKDKPEYRAVKQSLLGLAVAACDENDSRSLQDFYRQLITASEPEGFASADFDEQEARIDIFTRLAGESYFAYERAITSLEQLRGADRNNPAIIHALAMANYEVTVLLAQNPENRDRLAGYAADAEKYLTLAIEQSSGYEQSTLRSNLVYLNKLRQTDAGAPAQGQ